MTLQSIITTIGIPAIILALLYIGRKLQVLDTVEKTVETVQNQLGHIFERFVKVEERVNTLWKDEVAPANSPRQLNDAGKKILNESGIKEIIDTKKNDLLAKIKEVNPNNAYDAEQVTLDVVNGLQKHCPDIIPELKDGAYKTGQNIDTVLLVGGFYLRDIIFPELGYTLDDLDKPKGS